MVLREYCSHRSLSVATAFGRGFHHNLIRGTVFNPFYSNFQSTLPVRTNRV